MANLGGSYVIPDRTDSYFTLSPKLGITHDYNKNITYYGRLARGARAPQVTDVYSLQLGQTAGEIKSETLDSFELGLKGKVSGINLELAVFAMRKDNFFFRNADGFNVVDGKTNHAGVEFGFEAPLGNKIGLTGGFTLANHTYDFTDIVGSVSSSISKGDQVDTAPNTLGFMQILFKPRGSTNLAFKWQHVGDYYTDPGNTAKYPGHNVFTLRGDYQVTQQISIYGRVDNLFDAAYADRADFAFGSHRYFPSRPRTVFLGVRYKG